MVFLAVALMVVPLVIVGCKDKLDQEADVANVGMSTEATAPLEDVVVSQSPVTEPAATQPVVQETIPPTAAVPPAADTVTAVGTDKLSKNKDIQTALKASGFYTGNIDGKIGPKTKRAIVEFQKAKGLKADGKVGPKTLAELEKYLTTQQ
jgi:peptidoglycan hydrolase-like protein with peptidoglycan-binding domain